MPIYEFECTACGHRLDRLQKLSDPDPVDCPACAAPALRRRVSAPAFRLAGSGWYETDFKSDKDSKRNLAERGEAAASEAAPAAGSDAGASTPVTTTASADKPSPPMAAAGGA